MGHPPQDLGPGRPEGTAATGPKDDMSLTDIRRALGRAPASGRRSGPERRQQVRDLLAALAEIDHAFEADLETVRTSDAPVAVRQGVVDTLRLRHRERRAPLLRKLEALRTGASRQAPQAGR